MNSDSNNLENRTFGADDMPTISDTSDVLLGILEEQRQNFHRSELKPVEEYFNRHPILRRETEAAVDIIYNDFVLRYENRNNSGDAVQPQDYLTRFPEYAEQLQNQFQLFYGLGLDDGTSQESETLVQPESELQLDADDVRFELKDKLGTGGFACVYRAWDHQLNRFVAIKFARTEIEPDSRLYRRFQREAKSAARLSHPGIVAVHEFGSQDGRPFIVSRLMEGGTLADRIEKTKIPRKQAVQWLASVCEAIDYAHSCGVVHRDIKPANILFDNDDRPAVTDFGLASLAENEHTLTKQGELIGTPAFMSPEQARGQANIDAQSDVYSLGVVLYQLISGKLPFKGATSSVLRRAIVEEPAKPRSHDSSIPHDLQTICLKAMSKEKSARYQSARAMADDLRRFSNGEPILARPVGVAEKISKLIFRYPVVSALMAVVILISGIVIGVFFQYANVVEQRNRARGAEVATQQLLAKQSANSGELALRQGQTETAASHLQEALNRGVADHDRIRLLLAKCQMINGNIEHAVENIKLIEDASRADDANLLKVDLALRQVTEFGSPIDLIQSIDRSRLSPADREFLAGLNSKNSMESWQHFKTAMELEHYHHSARQMAAIMAMSLADFDYAIELCRSSLLLFSADREFLLIQALALAGNDELVEAYHLIDQAELSASAVESWKSFAEFINDICQATELEGNNELTYSEMIALINELVDQYAPLMKARNWHLPPRIAKTFASYLESEINPGQMTDTERLDAMTQLAETHPEATLNLLIAAKLLGSETANLEQHLTAQQLYETAIKSKGFVYEYRHEALEGAFAVAIHLALVTKHDVKQNLNRVRELLDQMNPARIEKPSHLRVITIHLINQGQLQLAEPYATRWIDVANEQQDRSQIKFAMWHQAIICQQQKQWYKLLVSCDEMLRLFPDEAEWQDPFQPKSLRDYAATQLQESVGNDDLPVEK